MHLTSCKFVDYELPSFNTVISYIVQLLIVPLFIRYVVNLYGMWLVF